MLVFGKEFTDQLIDDFLLVKSAFPEGMSPRPSSKLLLSCEKQPTTEFIDEKTEPLAMPLD
jgi:hypothetical protein